jgi:hypothetical protein
MSHDGCEEVKWKGQAFSYLMHHPNKFHQTENYGSSRAAAAGPRECWQQQQHDFCGGD